MDNSLRTRHGPVTQRFDVNLNVLMYIDILKDFTVNTNL